MHIHKYTHTYIHTRSTRPPVHRPHELAHISFIKSKTHKHACIYTNTCIYTHMNILPHLITRACTHDVPQLAEGDVIPHCGERRRQRRPEALDRSAHWVDHAYVCMYVSMYVCVYMTRHSTSCMHPGDQNT